jgi:hypothetical protein
MKTFTAIRLAAGLYIVLAIVLVSLLAACGVPPKATPAAPNPTSTPTPQFYNYVGRVVDAKTYSAIRGAEVALDFQGAPPIVYTDSEGVYRFSLPFTGPTLDGRVRVDANGYQYYERLITLTAGESNIEDIRLNAQQPTSAVSPVQTGSTDAGVAEPARLTVQIWDIAMDQKHAIVASKQFTGTSAQQDSEALLQEAGQWIVQRLGIDKRLEPVTVQVHIPADLSSGGIEVKSTPSGKLDVYYYQYTEDDKLRLPLSSTGPELATLNRDFYIEVGRPGYTPVTVPVRWGTAVNEEVELDLVPLSIAVEEFRNDPNAGAVSLTDYLSQYVNVLDPSALENLRKEIDVANAAALQSPQAQAAVRTTLGVDYIIDGTYSK